MAHLLDMTKGRAALAYVGGLPWHGLGTGHREAMLPDVAMRDGGLDFTVRKVPTFYDVGDGLTRASGGFAVVRSDSLTPVGNVGADFEAWQNAEAMTFARDVAGEARGNIVSAGAVMGGARCFVVIECPDLFTIEARGGKDAVRPYLLVSWGHDGKVRVRIMGTRVRVVCYNTLTLALAGRGEGVSHGAKHTSGMRGRIEAIRRALVAEREANKIAGEAFQAMAGRAMGPGETLTYWGRVFPLADGAPDRAKTNRDAALATVGERFAIGRGADVAGSTLWGAYNAVTEYTSHFRAIRGTERVAERRFLSVTEGPAAELAARAYTEALAVLAN
jgi:phage/plasmid-like protein (TIGR03299 family)